MKRLFILSSILLFGIGIAQAEVKIQTKPINKEMKDYISAKYKPAKGKKLVLHGSPNVPNCPHWKAFNKTIEDSRKNKKLAPYYSFRKTETSIEETGKTIKTAINFLDTCSIFCIVSLENNWIYAPFSHTFNKSQTAVLKSALTTLKNKK